MEYVEDVKSSKNHCLFLDTFWKINYKRHLYLNSTRPIEIEFEFISLDLFSMKQIFIAVIVQKLVLQLTIL